MMKILKFFKANYELKKPPKKNILFFDETNVEVCTRKLKIKPSEYAVIYSRFEKINLYVLIKSLLSLNFIKSLLTSYFKLSLFSYYLEYIKSVEPKIVITLIDNNITFYQFKKYFPQIKFISVQVGHRTENINDKRFFEKLKQSLTLKKNLSSDIYFVFNRDYGKLINRYIRCETKSIGSLRNNFVPKRITKKKMTILFLSQFRKNQPSHDNYLVERKLLPMLYKYCQFKKYSFFILGCSVTRSQEEEFFFKSIIGYNNWKFLKRKNYPKNYQLVDKFENIVFVDSTLGYEAIMRQKKVAVFSLRKLHNNGKSEKFGFPSKLKPRGFFYSNSCSYDEIKRVLDNVTNYSEKKWKSKILSKLNQFMCFDKNNTLLKKEIVNYVN